VWSKTYAQIPAAHVDWGGAFAAYAAANCVFSIVFGAIFISSGKSVASRPRTGLKSEHQKY